MSEYVTFNNQKYEVRNRELKIEWKQIKSILDVIGLEKLTSLETLYLTAAAIRKIEGLNNLKNLRRLELWLNPIQKIEGIDTLINLEYCRR
ncbi:MAG: hypothetical protein GF364_20120 [Candidatus Lokiarchaeota archaeon]|nr:hypothetical protein [Candidatus Lokiarchaeota archaeon]